jgi:hypothetical protein
MRTSDRERSVVQTAYSRWLPIYDAVCGPVMVKGRRPAAAARAIGGRILEVGVGTGLSSDDYDASTDISGIDLRAPMLAKAREKMASGCYPWVSDVQLVDAHQLGCRRDIRLRGRAIRHHRDRQSRAGAFRMPPRGEARRPVILVNHLYSETGIAAAVERWAAKRTRSLGLRPGFPFARVQASAQSSQDANLIERRKVAPFYTLVCFERRVPDAA